MHFVKPTVKDGWNGSEAAIVGCQSDGTIKRKRLKGIICIESGVGTRGVRVPGDVRLALNCIFLLHPDNYWAGGDDSYHAKIDANDFHALFCFIRQPNYGDKWPKRLL